ncbi:hypothetical protein [Virgibacillus necropolis]|uniref:Uncharacterized protein n=1 Tax=Virgibacillus necropolis TaxID=163877 RepID=A0A221MEK6_9BACI|nr:hypothetical protein [Virgibacillus necropolis]ASN06075.1 hypothetical protein CFK40_14130 [Virgibacillus necropolis]
MKLLDELRENDFAVLKGSLESGRQSPNSLGGMLILATFLQSLMFFLTYVVVADKSDYPFQEYMFIAHLILTIIIILLSIIYAFPTVYKRKERSQYLINIIVSQNLFGIFPYLFPLFIVGRGNATEKSLLTLTFVTLIIGVIIFIATCIRFNILLQKGHYRKGSKKDEVRGRFETKSYIPLAIIGGVGVVYLIQYMARKFYIVPIDFILIAILCIVIFYAMLFVLPEQLVILYCKSRFYQISEICNMINLLNECINDNYNNSENVINEINRLHKKLYSPRGGLTDFFIWKDNYDKRIKANKPLNRIDDELWEMLP